METEYFNEVDEADFGDMERLEDVPELARRPVDDSTLQPDALPITEDQCRKLYAACDLSFDAAARKSLKNDRVRAHLEHQILPALAKHLKFMGVESIPKIQIVSPGGLMPGGISPIRYSPYVAPGDMPSEDVDELLDTALTNADEGELPCTIGQVPIPAFSAIFCHIVAMADKSTTAHRRYKNKFSGERIRLVFHTEYNHAEMFVPEDLAKALDESVKCYLRGR
jgi:hypothetical protein